MAEKQSFMDSDPIALGDIKKDGDEIFQGDSLVKYIQELFSKSEESRVTDETRWLKAYRNYRGIYGPDVQFTETEKSRVFIKVTKTKTLAAYGQITDVLFANNRFPLSVDPTPIPDGAADSVHFDPTEPENMTDTELDVPTPFGYKGDGKELPPGATAHTLQSSLGPYKEKLKDVKNLRDGPGFTPNSITFHPAAAAAKKMEKKIHDQLDESGANKHLRSTAFEMALFGTGIMKGPFAINKEYPNWDENGVYTPNIKTVPEVSHVSIWNFYWDPDAINMDQCQYVIERHKMSRTELYALKRRPFFRSNVIDQVVEAGEGYVKKYWEDDLRDYAPRFGVNRYEVLEYWGNVSIDLLKENDVEIPKELEDMEE